MGKYYDPVVCCLLSNKVIKHQNWLASHQKLLSKLLVGGQQVATLAGGIVDEWENLGTLVRAICNFVFTTVVFICLWHIH